MIQDSIKDFHKKSKVQQYEELLHFLHDTLAHAPKDWKVRLKTFNDKVRFLNRAELCLNPTLARSAPIIATLNSLRVEFIEKFPGTNALDSMQFDETDAQGSSTPWIVWAHNLRSAHNLGSLIRITDCMGWSEVWTSGYSPNFTHKQVAESAMGAQDWVTHKNWENIEELLLYAKQENRPVYALERTHDSISIEQFDWPKKGILLLGNEELGVSPELLNKCDGSLSIPMFGRKASLNVSSAFSMAAFSLRT